MIAWLMTLFSFLTLFSFRDPRRLLITYALITYALTPRRDNGSGHCPHGRHSPATW